ncbi:hypothetical protein [Peribacillus asahii]|uniref:hypothetical protein n=1 Tax=Peribacillus asahii TaxID=228899 RepID=UPI00207A769B|nr:hypothetical protein [Peribacillus asahii]USK62297.1 hypothetical protein LIT37_24295 [Peribacillus asahii]
MIFSNAFSEMDNYIKQNLHKITCNEIYEIKEDFYKIVRSLSGSTANLTGITELLIYRFLYHALGMTKPVNNKTVQSGRKSLSIGKRFTGRNGKPQEPDIVIEHDETIKYLFSIKNLLNTVTPTNNEKESTLVQELIQNNGVCTTAIQDIFRIDNIRYKGNSNFKSITIVFSEVPPRHQKAIELIHQQFEWHRFLILEKNNKSFAVELSDKLKLIDGF